MGYTRRGAPSNGGTKMTRLIVVLGALLRPSPIKTVFIKRMSREDLPSPRVSMSLTAIEMSSYGHTVSTAADTQYPDDRQQEKRIVSMSSDNLDSTDTELHPERQGGARRVIEHFTWTPRRLRYDPTRPPVYSGELSILYAIVSPLVALKC